MGPSAPTGQPVAPDLFDRSPEGGVVLLGHRCHACGTPGFPRRATCGTCGAEGPEEVELGMSGGVLFGWTEVTAAPPGYHGPVPYWFGIVELDDGIRVLGRLVVPADTVLRFGQRMVCTLDGVAPGTERSGLGNELVVWAFAPASDADAPAPGGAG